MDNSDEEIDIKKNTLSKKKKSNLLDDSDEEGVPISKKVLLVDSDDKNNSVEINTGSMEKEETLNDSDEEDDPCPIRKKVQLIDSDEDDSDLEKNKSVKTIRKLEISEDDSSPIKNQSLYVNDEEQNGLVKNKVSMKNRRTWLDDSSDDESGVTPAEEKVSSVNSNKDKKDINSSSTNDNKTLYHSDDCFISVENNMTLNSSDNKNDMKTSSIDLKEKKIILEYSEREDGALLVTNVLSISRNRNESDTEVRNVSINKRKLFEDSDEEDSAVSIVENVSIDGINDEDRGTVSNKKKKTILEDSDDEDDHLLVTKNILSSSINKNESDTEVSTISNKQIFVEDNDEEDNTVSVKTNVPLNKSKKNYSDVDESIVLMRNNIILENSYGDDAIKEKSLLGNNTDNVGEKNDLSPTITATVFEDCDKEGNCHTVHIKSQANVNSVSGETVGDKNNQLYQNSDSREGK